MLLACMNTTVYHGLYVCFHWFFQILNFRYHTLNELVFLSILFSAKCIKFRCMHACSGTACSACRRLVAYYRTYSSAILKKKSSILPNIQFSYSKKKVACYRTYSSAILQQFSNMRPHVIWDKFNQGCVKL